MNGNKKKLGLNSYGNYISLKIFFDRRVNFDSFGDNYYKINLIQITTTAKRL